MIQNGPLVGSTSSKTIPQATSTPAPSSASHHSVVTTAPRSRITHSIDIVSKSLRTSIGYRLVRSRKVWAETRLRWGKLNPNLTFQGSILRTAASSSPTLARACLDLRQATKQQHRILPSSLTSGLRCWSKGQRKCGAVPTTLRLVGQACSASMALGMINLKMM